ncbi:MAG: beta-ketoacyl synthase N-terminal-like domain-containing protein [Nitrospirota bacterium]
MSEEVVITGVGLVSSLGLTLEETWKALLEGRSGIGPIRGFPAGGFTSTYAAQVEGLEAGALGVRGREARITDLHTLMLIKCLRDAFEGSGLEGSQVPRDEVAIFGGMGGVDYREGDLVPAVAASMRKDGSVDYGKFYGGAFREIYPLWPLGMLNNIAFCQAAKELSLRGENTVFSPHAEAGAQALREAALSVSEGRAPGARAAGVGGSGSAAILARAVLAGMAKGDALRPFSSERGGTVLGEGCAVLALERKSSLAQRGAAALARMTGYGEAFSLGEARPDGEAMARAMRLALESASLNPSGIDVLIAHGDGTPLGDEKEIEAINEVFSDTGLKVYSSKGALGHMLAGSPAVDAALAVQMIRTGTVPPTLGAEPLDERARFVVLRGGALEATVRRVMVSCLSVEGQCAAFVLEAAA